MRHVRYVTFMTYSLYVVTNIIMVGKHYMEFHAHTESSQGAQALKESMKYWQASVICVQGYSMLMSHIDIIWIIQSSIYDHIYIWLETK